MHRRGETDAIANRLRPRHGEGYVLHAIGVFVRSPGDSGQWHQKGNGEAETDGE